MQPLMHALPGALADVMRNAPLSPGKVSFAWRVAVGASLGRASSVQLLDRNLIVDATSSHWAHEIRRSSPLIMARLRSLLGDDTIDRIVVREP